MPGPIILVDLENVQQLEFSVVPSAARLIIFAGASQKSISLDFVIAGQALDQPAQWLRSSGNGPNALDFHIAFELGRLIERGESGPIYILSKDKGFDPLLLHVASKGVPCRRIETLTQIAAVAPMPTPSTERDPSTISIGAAFAATIKVREILSRSPKNARPRKRATLVKHIKAMQQLKLTEAAIIGVVDELLTTKLVVETHGQLSYNF